MDTCPKCGSNRVHRSRSKGFFEKIRREFSDKRLFRCHACSWRGWAVEMERPGVAADVPKVDVPDPDLNAIDEAMKKHPEASPESQAETKS